jgi:hypothetical protein
MRNSLLFLVVLAALGTSSAARASDVAICGDAFDQSQVKRDAGKLLDARQLFRACQAPSCSRTQQRLCSGWLADVEKRIPSLVLSAKDRSGADLVDVRVTMDGVQVATKLDGRMIDVDPGVHSFVFELADGTRAETSAVAEERNQGKLVVVTLEHPVVALSPSQTVSPHGPTATTVEPTLQETTSQGEGSALKTVGLVAGAAGVAGLALGTVFGIEALATKSSHCKNDGSCDDGSSSHAYSQATISTVGFVAGGVLLAGGVTLFLVASKARSEVTSTGMLVAPMVGSSAGGVQIAGRW